MVSGDIIREEGLDIYCHPPTRLENPLTLTPHIKELFKIDIPLMRIVMRVLCIGMSEIVRRGSDDQVDTPVRYTGKRLMCIRTYDTVDKGKISRGSLDKTKFFAPFEPFLTFAFPFFS